MTVAPLYESPELRKVTGATLRPGGFEPTRRGLEICGLTRGSTVLDMGCGLGATMNLLEADYGLKTYGLDASSDFLREGRSLYPWNRLVAGLGERLPFRENLFDAVFCECVLSLFKRPEQVLLELEQVLKPGGWLILSDLYARNPVAPHMLQELPLPSCLRGLKSRHAILHLVEEARFQPFLWEDHSKLLNRMAAKIVFEVGSMDKFWAQFVPDGTEAQLNCSLRRARPGYFLLVAKKKEERNG